MSTVMLVRHGETAYNAEGIFRGRADVPLNERGEQQAGSLAGYLQTRRVDVVYSSPLKRALTTAEVIAARGGLQAQVAPELIDLDCGEWQGLSRQKVEERYGDLYAQWEESPHLLRLPGGESLQEVRARALEFVRGVAMAHEGHFVFVSHRVVNKVLICGLLGLDDSHFWNIRLDVCGVTTFSYKRGRFVLIAHNDTSFLGTASALADF
ncbi:MAG: histidine phosphatase family protein [Chloroflexota bacterium]